MDPTAGQNCYGGCGLVVGIRKIRIILIVFEELTVRCAVIVGYIGLVVGPIIRNEVSSRIRS